jgi:hypothetical protein
MAAAVLEWADCAIGMSALQIKSRYRHESAILPATPPPLTNQQISYLCPVLEPHTFDVGSVNSLPYDPGTFDLVLCNHLLNDLEDPAQAIRSSPVFSCRKTRTPQALRTPRRSPQII